MICPQTKVYWPYSYSKILGEVDKPLPYSKVPGEDGIFVFQLVDSNYENFLDPLPKIPKVQIRMIDPYNPSSVVKVIDRQADDDNLSLPVVECDVEKSSVKNVFQAKYRSIYPGRFAIFISIDDGKAWERVQWHTIYVRNHF